MALESYNTSLDWSAISKFSRFTSLSNLIVPKALDIYIRGLNGDLSELLKIREPTSFVTLQEVGISALRNSA